MSRAVKGMGLTMLLGITLNACAWPGTAKQPTTPDQAVDGMPVRLVDGGLLASPSGKPELGLTLTNISSRTLWVSAHFKTPGGLTDCLTVKELEPQADGVYICPQPAIRTEVDYPVTIAIFSNMEQTRLEGTTTTQYRFEQADIHALESLSGP